jgi:proline-specific peptidase
MFGASDFQIVGTIHDWNVLDRLTEISVPTQLLAGKFDECSPAHMFEMHERVSGSRYEFFESTAHLPFIEEPGRFDQVMRDFLRQYDIGSIRRSAVEQ